MKRLIMVLSALMLFAVSAFAQDYVTKRTGEDIAAIVDEVGPDYIRYRLWEEPDGVLYTVNKSDVLLIRYATGRNEVFDQAPSIAVSPSLKYKEMARIYDYRNYTKSVYDQYSPAGSGIAASGTRTQQQSSSPSPAGHGRGSPGYTAVFAPKRDRS